MKRLILPIIAVLSLGVTATSASAATSQQTKMKTCNAEAKEKALKGDERKAFMKQCLSAKKDDGAKAKKD
jgi:hypothetical protein